MPTIVVASTNPVKIQATSNGFHKMFPDTAFHVLPLSGSSNVSDQPMSDAETLLGARNRANRAYEAMRQADYWIGIEGGVEMIDADMIAFAWIVVRSHDLIGKARTGTFFLPPAVTKLVQQGHELGVADDMIFNRSNSKQENGAVGILTDNVIDRMKLYEQAVSLACIPFKNRELYVIDTKESSSWQKQ